jgi:hypothetical protein
MSLNGLYTSTTCVLLAVRGARDISLREMVVLPITRPEHSCLVGQKASASTPLEGEMQARHRLRDGSGDFASCSVREHLMTGERRGALESGTHPVERERLV